MRTATIAKLSLTAMVGLATLIGPANLASAGSPPKGGQIATNPGHGDPKPGDIKTAPPTTSTTMKPIGGHPWDPKPDPPYDPDFPIANPPDDDHCPAQMPNCDLAPRPQGDDPEPDCPAQMPNCDLAPRPQGDDDPKCPDLLANCDEVGQSDPGCNVTHGCDEGTTGGTDDGGTDGRPGDGTTGGTDSGGSDPGTTGGGTDGGTDAGSDGHGGRLPKTGGDIVGLAALGLGLTGAGTAVKRFGRRRS